MKLTKKFFTAFFISIIAISSIIPISANAASTTSKQYPVRPTEVGDYDSLLVLDHSGGKILVRANVYGIHSGQQAYIKWTLRKGSTVVSSVSLYGDFNGNIDMGSHSYGDYTVTWESRTPADTAGWFSVTAQDATFMH